MSNYLALLNILQLISFSKASVYSFVLPAVFPPSDTNYAGYWGQPAEDLSLEILVFELQTWKDNSVDTPEIFLNLLVLMGARNTCYIVLYTQYNICFICNYLCLD